MKALHNISVVGIMYYIHMLALPVELSSVTFMGIQLFPQNVVRTRNDGFVVEAEPARISPIRDANTIVGWRTKFTGR